MTVKDFIGYASAATLGYITGDVRGAKAAIKLYKNFNNMPAHRGARKVRVVVNPYHSPTPTPKKQRRKLSIHSIPSSSSSGSRRSSVISMLSSRRSSASSVRSKRTSDRSLESRGSIVSRSRTKKRVKALHKRVKRVKVSFKLRKKINKVLEGKMPKGYYQETYLGTFSTTVNNGQESAVIKGPTVDGVQGEFFSPTQIQNAASILWNRKTPTASYNFADAGSFNPNNVKINVVKQWATIKYRNNTERIYYLNIYACRRKISEPSTTAQTSETDWKQAMQIEGTSNVNVNTITNATLYATPFITKSMSDKYDIECTKVIMAPGEEYTYTITGPSRMYDFRKFYFGNAPYPFNKKMNVNVFHVAYNDLISTSTGTANVGRIGNNDAAAGYSIIYEVNMYYKLEMPEQTGITWATAPTLISGQQAIPVAGNTSYIGNRRDAYAIFNNGATSITGNPVRVEREQPNTLVTPQ